MNSIAKPKTTNWIIAATACTVALAYPGSAAASHEAHNQAPAGSEENAQVDLPRANARKTMRSGRVYLRVHCPASDCRVRSQVTYERPDGRRLKKVNEGLGYAAWVRAASPSSIRRGSWPLDQYEPPGFEGGVSGVPVHADREVTLPIRLAIKDPALRRAASASGAVARVRSEVLMTEENWSGIDVVSDSPFPDPIASKGPWVEVGVYEIPLQR